MRDRHRKMIKEAVEGCFSKDDPHFLNLTTRDEILNQFVAELDYFLANSKPRQPGYYIGIEGNYDGPNLIEGPFQTAPRLAYRQRLYLANEEGHLTFIRDASKEIAYDEVRTILRQLVKASTNIPTEELAALLQEALIENQHVDVFV